MSNYKRTRDRQSQERWPSRTPNAAKSINPTREEWSLLSRSRGRRAQQFQSSQDSRKWIECRQRPANPLRPRERSRLPDVYELQRPADRQVREQRMVPPQVVAVGHSSDLMTHKGNYYPLERGRKLENLRIVMMPAKMVQRRCSHSSCKTVHSMLAEFHIEDRSDWVIHPWNTPFSCLDVHSGTKSTTR